MKDMLIQLGQSITVQPIRFC